MGGVVLNDMRGEHLLDLFKAGTLQEYFAALSERLGFHLSVYSPTGARIFTPGGKAPLCDRLRSSSPLITSQCDSYCRPFLLNTLATGKPDVFRCFNKIVSFALPIEYLSEKAVIMGQGSFASQEDFRECMKTAGNAGLAAASQAEPLGYTSIDKAWDVCGFVSESMQRILQKHREAVTLRKEFDGIKQIIGSWSASAGDQRSETLYRNLTQELVSLINIEDISVYVPDKKQGGFTPLPVPAGKSGALVELGISEQREIMQALAAGRPFVFSARPLQDHDADRRKGHDGLYFFPIMVNNKLEGILCVADRGLAEFETQIISAFCRKTALTLENHRLHQELYRKFDRFIAVSELTKAITPIQDFNMLLHSILDESAGLLRAEQGSLMLIDRETEELLMSAKKGVVDGVTDKLRIQRGEGIAGRVAELGEAFLVEDLESDPRFRQKNRSHYKTRSFVSVPLRIEDRVIGVLNLSDKSSGDVFDEEDLRLIQSFATHAAVVMDRNVFQNRAEELEKMSITDPLTGLLNRRHLQERLKRELARAERHGHNLSLLMIDIDGFKQCNDTFGHPFGDNVLKNVADVLLNTVRSMDLVARYGGDEFMVLLPETEEPVAIETATRLLHRLEQTIEVAEGPGRGNLYKLTASIGVVCYPKDGGSLDMLHEHVDQALYRAKNKGRNRVEFF